MNRFNHTIKQGLIIILLLLFTMSFVEAGQLSKINAVSSTAEISINITENETYLIITSSALVDSLEFFKNWKEHIGFHVEIINVSWITVSYEGRDTAEQIRNFLKDIYLDWNVTYLLLAGDISVIPMRYTYQPKSTITSIPTDYYYAELTSDWDSNNDGFFAEVGVDAWPEFDNELYVGRIPVNDSQILKQICQRIIQYEQDPGSWKQNTLFLASIINFKNEVGLGHPKTDTAHLMELLRQDIFQPQGFSTTTLYEEEGLSPTDFPSDYPLTRENAIDQLGQGYGYIIWSAHGGASHIYRKWWMDDRNLNRVPDFNEIENETFISSHDAVFLPSDQPAIVFSCSCNNARPEHPNNLGKAMLSSGSVGFIGASHDAYYNYGWDALEDGGSMSFTYYFFDKYIRDGQSLGTSFFDALLYCLNEDDINLINANMYVFTLYGDPSLSTEIYTGTSIPDHPEKPQGLIDIQADILFNYTTTADSSEQLLYYIWDFGDGTITKPLGPVASGTSVSIKHSWDAPGDYRIKVKAVNLFGEEGGWSEPLLIHVTGPVIKVKQITGGLFKINAVIENTGDQEAQDISWSLRLNGGSILIGRQTTGMIQAIPAGGKTTIVSKIILGVGLPSVVLVEAGIEQGSSDVEVQSANIIGSFISIT